MIFVPNGIVANSLDLVEMIHNAGFYLSLMDTRKDGAHVKRVIQRYKELAFTYESWLLQYPEVRVEPLDRIYQIIIVLAKMKAGWYPLDRRAYHWRTSVELAFFLCLAPDHRYLAILEDLHETTARSKWITRMAIDRIKGFPSEGNEAEFENIQEFAALLARVKLPHIPLRPEKPTEYEQMLISEATEELRKIYKIAGTRAAKLYAKNTILSYNWGTYKWWLKERLTLPFLTDRKFDR